MFSILYWVFLIAYLSFASIVFFFIGINWYTLETKKRRSPPTIVAVAYIVNDVVLYFMLEVPILLIFIINVLQMGGLYMGSHFQCIGLTGGIATGKSTVSNILADNGFDIIDSDKISREVGASLYMIRWV